MANPKQSPANMVDRLAQDYLERLRLGERPEISEYAQKHSDLADQIWELFPTLAAVENLVSDFDSEPDEGDLCLDEDLPERIGGYRIIRRLGAGGMGVVYEAEQISLNRHVALKVLPPSIAQDHVALRRFQREARAVARLQHDNIAQVYEVGQDGATSYYVMQFVHGQSLEAIKSELVQMRSHDGKLVRCADDELNKDAGASGISSGSVLGEVSTAKFPGGEDITSGDKRVHRYFRSVAKLGVQAAEALAYSHHEGILHRDIKPSNLMLDADGKVWLIDFGLAKIDGEDLTTTGDVVGTVRYMAPERFEGWSDPRSDLYGLGLTLYEMLTLTPAFSGRDRVELIRRVSNVSPTAMRICDARIPRDLETIVHKSICKQPRERYQTCQAFADDLKRWLDGKPIRARRNSILRQSWQWCRRQPYLAAAIATILMLLIVVSIGSSLAALNWQTLHGRSVLSEQRERKLAADAREQLVASNLALIQMTRNSGLPGQRFKSLDLIRQTVPLTSRAEDVLQLRNDAIAAFANVDVQPIKAWASPRNQSYVYFDPAFERYGESDQSGNVSIKSVSTNQPIVELPGSGQWLWVHHFSSDCKYFAAAYTGPSWLSRLWDLRKREAILVSPGELQISPDSKQVAIASSGGVEVRNLEEMNDVIHILQEGDSRVGQNHRASFHPAKPWVSIANGTDQVHIFDLEQREFVENVRFPVRANAGVWHPHGTLLATASHGVYIHDLLTGKVTPYDGHDRTVGQLNFHSSGRVFATVGRDVFRWFWCTYTGRRLLRVEGFHQFASDGSKVALSRRAEGKYMIEICRMVIPSELQHVRIPKSSLAQIWDVSIDPTDHYLAIGCSDGVRVVDIENLKLITHLPAGSVSSLFFTSDMLIAVDQNGVQRWDVKRTGGEIQFESPQQLVSNNNPGRTDSSLSANGRLLAIPAGKMTKIIDLKSGQMRALDTGSEQWPTAILSPDGNYLATRGKYSNKSNVRVWNAKTNEHVHDLPVLSGRANVCFSPDSRLIVTSTVEAFEIWEVGSWKRIHMIPRNQSVLAGKMAFSSDGKTLAVAQTAFWVKLIDTQSFEEIATLEDPNSENVISALKFTNDASKIMVAREFASVESWDLLQIVQGLDELSLGWDLNGDERR